MPLETQDLEARVENLSRAARRASVAADAPGLDEVTRLLKSLPRDGQLRRELVRRRWQKADILPAPAPSRA